MSTLESYLKTLAKELGTDLYLVADAAPTISISGENKALSKDLLTGKALKEMADGLMDATQKEAFEHDKEMNLSVYRPNVGRFRVNIYWQRGQVSMVIRRISLDIPTRKELNLPEVTESLISEEMGLVLVVGSTGSGKTTSLASMIRHRSETRSGHIVTIEDPIEFIHPHAKSLVSQRELGIDTNSYHQALKSALRQAPDVILIGEIRTAETMEHALAFAQTGHLCIATLHANNAVQTLERILNFFPEEKRMQVLHDLSNSLKGIIAQRLVAKKGGGLQVATEVLLGTPTVCDYIRKNALSEVRGTLEKAVDEGMHTIDQDLKRLVDAGLIDIEAALQNAESENNLRISMKSSDSAGKSDDNGQAFSLREE